MQRENRKLRKKAEKAEVRGKRKLKAEAEKEKKKPEEVMPMSGERTKEIQRHRLMPRTAWAPRERCLISVHLKKRRMVNRGAGDGEPPQSLWAF